MFQVTGNVMGSRIPRLRVPAGRLVPLPHACVDKRGNIFATLLYEDHV